MGKPDNDETERKGAQMAILREYGHVIGENQALNIAYHALGGARFAKFEEERQKADEARTRSTAAQQQQ